MLKDIVEATPLEGHLYPFARLSNLFGLSGFLVRYIDPSRQKN